MANILDAFQENQDAKKAIDTSKKLKIGIIGTGWIADAHMASYLKQPDIEIVAGADLIPGKAEAFFKKHGVEGVRCYPDHKAMIDAEKDLDGVSVCTYNATHAECSIYALEHGVNVLLEKPMCVTMDEATALYKAEKASGKILSIGFQPRFNPTMQQIKKVISTGVLGKIYYIQTGGGRRHGIPTPFGTTFIEKKTAGLGALGDIGCYALDAVLNAIGYPKPLTVTGYKSAYLGKNPNYYIWDGKPAEYADLFGVDDFAAGFVRMENDIILDFRISWAMQADSMGDTIILGTDGALRIPAKKDECWNGGVGGPLVLYQSIAGKQVETIIPEEKQIEGESDFDRKIRSFADAIKEGTPSPVSIDEIIYNQAILSGIAESAELGHEIEIKLDI